MGATGHGRFLVRPVLMYAHKFAITEEANAIKKDSDYMKLKPAASMMSVSDGLSFFTPMVQIGTPPGNCARPQSHRVRKLVLGYQAVNG